MKKGNDSKLMEWIAAHKKKKNASQIWWGWPWRGSLLPLRLSQQPSSAQAAGISMATSTATATEAGTPVLTMSEKL